MLKKKKKNWRLWCIFNFTEKDLRILIFLRKPTNYMFHTQAYLKTYLTWPASTTLDSIVKWRLAPWMHYRIRHVDMSLQMLLCVCDLIHAPMDTAAADQGLTCVCSSVWQWSFPTLCNLMQKGQTWSFPWKYLPPLKISGKVCFKLSAPCTINTPP